MGTRFSRFGIVINPEITEKIEWKEFDQSKLLEKLRELKFITKNKLEEALIDITIEGQPKKGKTELQGEAARYDVKIVDYGGQLEQGIGGTPHWQLWIETKPQTTKNALLKALSRKLYNNDQSKAISVQESGLSDDDLKQYCKKDGRLEISGEFSDNLLDKTTREYVDYLRENPSLKKYMIARGHIKDTFFNF